MAPEEVDRLCNAALATAVDARILNSSERRELYKAVEGASASSSLSFFPSFSCALIFSFFSFISIAAVVEEKSDGRILLHEGLRTLKESTPDAAPLVSGERTGINLTKKQSVVEVEG